MEHLPKIAASFNMGDPLAKLVYLVIVANSVDWEYTASYGQLAKLCGISKSTVSVKLQYLQDNGYVLWHHNHTAGGNITANTYIVNSDNFT